ncbi:hypothetical protein [Metallosphaera hakonensis]|uniref:Uncharacterized protein n=1 Tax=Metallosphaera hakonensis JCM 8857 = DSM 7519 TaxID=1293036 RepID=A0A2U9IRW5_9CREN|nr:hypothetical protein [Metallosphaera hakonensis]AWR98745.1 hypothetical protein DFR87_02520 [Metallosphaera hakonensis JCM 8857 = DSM 7519]
MDSDKLALLGEAGATGLARGIYIVIREEKFRHALEDELAHWRYFQKRSKSILERPVYFALLLFGIAVALFGRGVTRRVVNYLEAKAIEFYLSHYDLNGDIKMIVEQEKDHII